MPRRSVLTEAQRADLLALPEDEATLIRHWTLSTEDLRIIVSRRRPHNRLGFAIQLCGLRYPGRLLRPGEVIRHAPLAFVGEQLGIAPEALANYAARGPTRYEQLDTLRDVFGFQPFSRPVRVELQAWLLPPALTTTNGAALARLLLDELRRRRIIVPGITPVERMPVADTAIGWLAERKALLARRLVEVEAKIAADALEDVQLANGRLRISPLRAITPDEAEGVLAPLYAHLPSIRITDLLADVDRWTGLTGCFTHLTTGRPHDDPRAILTAVLADATNLGHARMAEACELVTQRQLGWLSAWHLREDSYGAALARLAEAQHRMPLAAMFGSGTASSSDGQNFPLDRRAQATGAINPHKGSDPAVFFYTHVSDRYAPFHSRVISAGTGEAAHVLDGLLHHGADLAIERHHTDGGGVSDHVFALCHLLGFRFAPRIPNIAARRLHLFADMRPGSDIAPLAAQPIDEALIADHWMDAIRLATSIRTGVTSASVMLERLGSYPRANGLALALREIGRVERTLFTLDWIERPEERRQATRELNKGEAQNALKRAIFFHRIGRIRDHGLQAQGHRASALNLVAGAIVLWNTTYLEAAMCHLDRQGRPVSPDLLQHLSPLGWQHINLTGDYLWSGPGASDDKLRPLRQTTRLPA